MKAPEKIYLVKYEKDSSCTAWRAEKPEDTDEYVEYLRADLAPMKQADEADADDQLYQCPYDISCKCRMDKPCKGCETWAKTITMSHA